MPRTLEIVANCKMCGNPVYGTLQWKTEDGEPEVKRTCFCVAYVPVMYITPQYPYYIPYPYANGTVNWPYNLSQINWNVTGGSAPCASV